MARALHRAEREITGGRLSVRSEEDIFLDHANRLNDDPGYYGTDEFERLHALMLEAG